MPTAVKGQTISMQAASGVSAITYDSNHNYSSGGIKQFSAVKADSSGAVPYDFVAATTGDLIIGFVQSNVGGSQSAPVQINGVTKARAKGAVTVGAQCYVGDSTGAIAVVTAEGATSVNAVGVALTPATADGDIFTLLIQTGSQRVAS